MTANENEHEHGDTPAEQEALQEHEAPRETPVVHHTADEGDHALRETVARLDATVASLTEQVNGLTEPKEQDSKPVKQPWHKRKWGSN